MLQSEGIWRVRKYVFGVFLLVSFAVSMIAARSVVLVDDLGSLSAYAFVIAAGAYNIAVLAIFRWWRDRSRLVFFIVGAVGVISGAGIGIARPLAHSVESLSYAVAFLSLATVLHLVLTVILMAGSSES